VADLAPNIKEIEIRWFGKTVILADKPSGVAGRFPQFPGVHCILRHGRLIAAAAVLVWVLARPKRDARGHTERMGGERMLIAHPFIRQPLHLRCFTEGVAIEVTGGRLLLVGHDDENVRLSGHGVGLSLWGGMVGRQTGGTVSRSAGGHPTNELSDCPTDLLTH
jgi:hypothetical protein